MPPGYLACHLQDSHVPLLIYAPGLTKEGRFKPGVYPQPCGQPDVFPTLATLAGIPFRYTGMGRNLFDPDTRRDARQFVAGNNEAFMRLVEDGYCYITEAEEALYRLDDPDGRNLLAEEPERAAGCGVSRQIISIYPSTCCIITKKQHPGCGRPPLTSALPGNSPRGPTYGVPHAVERRADPPRMPDS